MLQVLTFKFSFFLSYILHSSRKFFVVLNIYKKVMILKSFAKMCEFIMYCEKLFETVFDFKNLAFKSLINISKIVAKFV